MENLFVAKQEPNHLMKRLNMWILSSIVSRECTSICFILLSSSAYSCLRHTIQLYVAMPLNDAERESLGIQMVLYAWLFSRSELILLLMVPQSPTACSLHLAVSAPWTTRSV